MAQTPVYGVHLDDQLQQPLMTAESMQPPPDSPSNSYAASPTAGATHSQLRRRGFGKWEAEEVAALEIVQQHTRFKSPRVLYVAAFLVLLALAFFIFSYVFSSLLSPLPVLYDILRFCPSNLAV